MFYVDKKASAQQLDHCAHIMDKIVAENPSYWPYGCNPDMFNGGVYLIRKSANHEPVGFTGWQEFDEDGKKVGYYSIGILPEYRQQGFAKEAVAKLIHEKSAGVDEVRAFVMNHNTPSLELAKSLKVNTLVKNAMGLKGILGRLAGGLAAAGGTDYMVHEGDYSHFTPSRIGNAVLNTILGATGTHLMASPKPENFMKGLATLGLLPTKDLAFSAVGAMPKVEALINKKLQEQPAVNLPVLSDKEKLMLGGLLGAGTLGVVGSGLGISRALNKAQEKRDAGRIQLRLPTRDKNDQETVVDVPLDQANLPPALVSKVMRDTRRKLREETKARTWRRDGKNRLLTNAEPYDYDFEDEEDQVAKAAFAYYRTKVAASNFASSKPITVVNTLAPSPEEQKQKLEQQKFEQSQKPDQPGSNENVGEQQQLLSDLQEKQQKLMEANDNLQKQMASMQHTNDLNRESLKNISARTSSIASNLKIAGLIKLSATAGTPNEYRTYSQFVKEDMPAAWADTKAVGEQPGFFQNTFLKPDAVRRKEYEDYWNQNYKKDPKFLGDYLSNIGTQAGINTAKGLEFLTSPIKATFRRGAFGLAQAGDAMTRPLETGETWYNPSMARIKGMLGGAGNVTGGIGLTALQALPFSGAVTKAISPVASTTAQNVARIATSVGAGALGEFTEPGQNQNVRYSPNQQELAASRSGYYTPDQRDWMLNRLRAENQRGSLSTYLNELPGYAFGSMTPQGRFYKSLGVEDRPLSLAEQAGLALATGDIGNVIRNQLSGLTGGLLFNDPARGAAPLSQQNIQNMRTPIQ